MFAVLANVFTGGVRGFEFLAMLLVLLCPPWEIFWGGIGEPQNVGLWLKLSAMVILANGLLYVPIGMAHAITSHRRILVRLTTVTLVGVGSLGLGHLFFLR